MKKVPYRNLISKVLGVSLVVALLLSNSLLAQESTAAPSGEGDAVKGKQLFNQNCAACHALNKKMTGPALAGVSEKYDREWLHQWVKNSPAMIKSGDPDALKIYNEYNQAAMTPFPLLSDQDIDDILAYTDAPPVVAATPVAVSEGAQGAGDASGISN